MSTPTLTRRDLLAWGLFATLPGLASAQRLNPFAGISRVEVFCNSAMLIEPVANPPFKQTIYRLDAMEQMVRALNQRLPQGGEDVARAWAMANLAQIRKAFAPAVAEMVNAVNLASYYRIDHLPAIVIDARAVIYGVPRVAEAISRYQAHRQSQGGQR